MEIPQAAYRLFMRGGTLADSTGRVFFGARQRRVRRATTGDGKVVVLPGQCELACVADGPTSSTSAIHYEVASETTLSRSRLIE